MTARGSATTTEPRMQTAAAMQTARPDPARELGPEERATQYTLGSSVCDDIAEVVREVRAALREGRYDELRQMAHPLALRREQARLARRFGAGEAVDFWSDVRTHVEAVRIVGDGVGEAYEEVRHHRTSTTLRLACTVEHVRGHWRVTDTREANDERVTAVLLRGAPPEQPLDVRAWTREWNEAHGPTAVLTVEGQRGLVEHPDKPYRASIRTGSGHELSRALGLSGAVAELLDKQPAATIVSLAPAFDAAVRNDQLRWVSRVVTALGARDASSVWVPSAAKAMPYSSWRGVTEGPLELPALSALWLRTQRQRGAWVTRGLTTFMLPEIEVFCAGLSVATVRALLREAVGRMLSHHQERERCSLGANAPAVLGVAPRLYKRAKRGPELVPIHRLETALDVGDRFVAGEVESVIAPGRQGPRPGESYGRWGAIALRSEPAWWLSAA